ncbi:MAG: rhomboid family intramembrane serine protease [Deltaproteobacteria bacterium]|nr:rhomboid family intramembrane serine protease [Deltaproteobacteria bacterium]
MRWWESLLKNLGLDPVKLRWWWHRRKEQQKRAANARENRRRALSYRHKLCPSCGLTVDRDEATCPRCQHRLPGPLMARLQRTISYLVPGGAYTYTSVFVGFNVVLYLVMLLKSTGGQFDPTAAIKPLVAYRFGAWTSFDVFGNRQLWRLVTPIFLHFDLLHLVFNCLWLVQLGPLLEQGYGRSRFLALYLLCGTAGFALSATIHLGQPAALGAGASGVVFGLMGAAVTIGYLRRPSGSEVFRSGLAKWVLFGLVMSFLPGIDLWAHLGGFVAGGAFAMLTDLGRARRRWIAVEIACLIALFGCWVLAWQTKLPTP